MNYTNIDDHDSLEKLADMVILNCKHDFSADELKQEADQLAQCVSDKQQEENNKKVAMSVFKNKIDTLEGEIKFHASNINHGFTYIDKATVLFLDFVNNRRVYFDKQNGNFIRDEAFHPADYQKKIDFTGISPETQEQIDFNNAVAGLSEKPTPKDNLPEHYGKDFEAPDALDVVIGDKIKTDGKKISKKAESALSKALIPQGDIPKGMHIYHNGNLTDLPETD